jgi:hypothetical protein
MNADGMRGNLAALIVQLIEVRQASLFSKAAAVDVALAQAVNLLGIMVDRIETLEREQRGKN